LFVEIADAYFEREMYAEASPLYELLGEDATVRNVFSGALAIEGALILSDRRATYSYY
jgi:hypothetical protein